jgi:hypothetical protein
VLIKELLLSPTKSLTVANKFFSWATHSQGWGWGWRK